MPGELYARLQSAALLQPETARSFIDSLDQLRDTVLELSPQKHETRKQQRQTTTARRGEGQQQQYADGGGDPIFTARSRRDDAQRTSRRGGGGALQASARASARGSARGGWEDWAEERKQLRLAAGLDATTARAGGSTARASAREVLGTRRGGAKAAKGKKKDKEIIPPSEQWRHNQTIPGFIGGNPFLHGSRLPATARMHTWGDALKPPIWGDVGPPKARRDEGYLSEAERAENWKDHDHFGKRAHDFTEYMSADARNNCLSAFNRR